MKRALLLLAWSAAACRGGSTSSSAPAVTPVAAAAPAPAAAGEDWNDAIAWMPFDRGMEAAARENKPLCLVFYTTWCPHCRNYSAVFHDARVVEKSREFIMVRLDKDKNPELSRRYAPDGEYIPRTYFVAPTGVLTDVDAQRPKFRFFYDEKDPAGVLGGMDRALASLR